MKKQAPALMIQGTASNSGKSLIAAAVCRILHEDGFNPRPFKAQNMALNSCVTPRGEEMGRAQAVQAAACGVEPDARMNPVLLKPVSDCGSQVVVMGRGVATMRAREYMEYKATVWRAVKDAYASLAAEAGVMVLEGAGSPAEINLKKYDIVNMAMARHAGARVLLAADIDRGGAFAALAGTYSFLTPSERALVAGFVLNKFRGDASLLKDALSFTSRRTGRPFFGVIPWLGDHGLPEEDSVSFKELAARGEPAGGATLGRADVAVIDLPRISNFTDLDPLKREPGLSLRLVRRAADLGRPDAVILPGSRNVPGDLAWMRANGLAEAVERLGRAADGPMIIGICGGLQMLGASIADPLGLEGGGRTPGLGLLDLHTELKKSKTLALVRARHEPSGICASGYEIHHGVTAPRAKGPDIRSGSKGPDIRSGSGGPGVRSGSGGGTANGVEAAGAQSRPGAAIPCFTAEDGRCLGFALHDGRKLSRVWGVYAHGIFDGNEFRRFMAGELLARKGIKPIMGDDSWSLDAALGRLAAAVRAHLDMEAVYRELGLK